MIGKIVAGSGAGGVTSYVTQKDGAEILSSTWSGPAELWAAQIDAHTQEMGSSVAQTVVHVSLSADPADGRLSDDQWRAVSEEYLVRMGWGEHDHAVVRHTDTQHDHVHIIVSRVGRDGQTADLHNDFPRQERVLDGIERDLGLKRTHEALRLEAEKDPYRAVESATRSSLTFDRERIERYFDRLGFEPDKTRELTDRALRDERVLAAGQDRFTTQEVRGEVQQLDSALRSLAGQDARPLLDRGERAREGLDAGQRAAADQIAAGRGLTVIEGIAGAGKSTMLRTAAEDLRFSGHDVIGVAPSGKAAKGLQDSAGIESNTLTRTLMNIERGDTKLTRDSIVIVDEAGMARNSDLGKLAQHVADAGGRLVLVGDERQLGAVGRGGGFAEAREIAAGERGTARLDEIHRQREGWQKDASRAFGEGRARDAVQAYIDHGKVEWAASRGTARDMLVSDYVREMDRGTSPDQMLALAHENRDVRALNSEIRDAIKERGGLADARGYVIAREDGKTQKIEIGTGDRVVFEKNQLGVKNGEFGTVVRTDKRGFDVRIDDGRTQRVEDGGQHQMSHGYASSVHKSQGATVDKTYTLASKSMDSKLTYVAMSRQREDAKMYANKTEFKNAEHLKSALSRDGGREAFKSVRNAGAGKERQGEQAQGKEQGQEKGRAQGKAEGKAQTRTADQGHGPLRGAEKEKQPVASYIAAAGIDQRKISSGMEQRGQGHGPPAQEKSHEAAGRARGAGQEKGKEQSQQQGKAQAQAQVRGQHGAESGKAEDRGQAGNSAGKSESKSKGYGL